MPPALIDPRLPKSLSVPSSSSDSERSKAENRRFGALRGLQWRINLGVLPSSASTSVDDLRRATADSRRRYAGMRRRLLVDPHVPKDGSNSPNLVMDNPLSQNPDSTWSRFFRNAELERMVDKDLSRLYPEHESFFQNPGCQGMLRRILLLWCLGHPECGYRQGMHELLAPLLYVLQVDVEGLSEVRKIYEDHFTDRFDDLLCQENDLSFSFDIRKSPDLRDDEIGSHANAIKVKSLDELDPEIRAIVLLSDAYGAEGELGIVLSEKFIEHDAYCMFNALMNGAHGSIAMADFFSSSTAIGSHTGLTPVIEASTACYHLLSLVDSSLHGHLVDLGVEPQYFALRWLRVLFGREFSLDSLLIIWDEIFESDNSAVQRGAGDDVDYAFRILHSPRGAFISAMAVAMLLYLRSSLLATENPTTCLQRLLNFPEEANIKKLLEKAKSLKALALSADVLSSLPSFVGDYNQRAIMRSQTLPSESIPPKTPLSPLHDGYWEEKWRVVQETEELKQNSVAKQIPRKRGWTVKLRFLKRTESDPCPSKVHNRTKESKTVRRSLLEDLSRELGFEECVENMPHEILHMNDNLTQMEEGGEDGSCKNSSYTTEDRCLSGNSCSEENSSMFSDANSPPFEANDHENDSEKSSHVSNISIGECNDNSPTIPNDGSLPVFDSSDSTSDMSGPSDDTTGNSVTGFRERKLSGKFQWLWKFGRNTGEDLSDEGGGASDAIKSANNSCNQSNTAVSSTVNGHCYSASCKSDSVDHNVVGTLRNLGQSMLEHIQVIECVFQQDKGQEPSLVNVSENVLVSTGHLTAMTALKELRKISNLLSDM